MALMPITGLRLRASSDARAERTVGNPFYSFKDLERIERLGFLVITVGYTNPGERKERKGRAFRSKRQNFRRCYRGDPRCTRTSRKTRICRSLSEYVGNEVALTFRVVPRYLALQRLSLMPQRVDIDGRSIDRSKWQIIVAAFLACNRTSRVLLT